MIRYRCPHCAGPTVAHERRAGQSSVCKACLKPHKIPADEAPRPTEPGEPLRPAAPPAAPSEAPAAANPDLTAVALDLPLHDPIVVEPAPRAPQPVPEPQPAPPVRAARVSQPQPPATADAGRPDVATATPPPALASGALRRAPTPAPPAVRGAPVRLQTPADIALALIRRLAPPARPRRDPPSAAAWALLTGVGLALVFLALFVDARYAAPALFVGIALGVIGYVWIVHLTRRRDARRGLFCALTPMLLYYLTRYEYARLRPLRFVLTGWVLTLLALLAPRAGVRPDRAEPPAAAADPAAGSRAEPLRADRVRPPAP